ncbi:MAG: lysophospholipid acyltransferase family protein [Spirochaetota bacterium]
MNWLQSLLWKIFKYTYGFKIKLKYKVKKVSDTEIPERPFILIANYSHFMDPYFISVTEPYPIVYLLNTPTVKAHKQKLPYILETIPEYTKNKKQYFPVVAKMLNKLREKKIIGLLPEETRSWDGETQDLKLKTVKFLKRLNKAIRIARIKGSYLTQPRWAETRRKGKIRISTYNISKEELETMDERELKDKLDEYLHQNDIKDEELQQIKFKGQNLASGIQYILWLCPNCNAEDSIYGKENTVYCKNCDENWEIDGNLRIISKNSPYKDLKDWADWQKENIKNRIKTSDDDKIICSSKNVELLYTAGTEFDYDYYSNGDLNLYKDKLVFKPYDKNREVIEFLIEKIMNYKDYDNVSFEFNYLAEYFKVKSSGKNASKWTFFWKEIQSKS